MRFPTKHIGRTIARRRGLTLIEAMISLAISSTLLTAVGAAFSGSAKAIENNDQFYRAVQAARVTVNQVMTEVRRCSSLTVYPDKLDMNTYALEHRIYAYLSANGTMTITRENVSPWITNTMSSNLTNCSFATDGQTVTMYVTVQVGNNQVVLSGSATPRRTVTYQ